MLGVEFRTEHWANALNQPTTAARGDDGPRRRLRPTAFFFTDQYDLGMEYVGDSEGYRRLLTRSEVAGREFSAFWLDADDRVLAGMNVNVWDSLDDIRTWCARGFRWTDRLTDPGCNAATERGLIRTPRRPGRTRRQRAGGPRRQDAPPVSTARRSPRAG